MKELFDEISTAAMDWLSVHGLKIALILIGVIALKYIAQKVIRSIVHGSIKSSYLATDLDAEIKREDTLVGVLSGVTEVLLWATAVIMIIAEFGIEVGPVLAAAGIAGVALGFGSQYLIKDVIAGFFIIIENQFSVGDVVRMDSTSGLVEEITLRKTTLRDMDGIVHNIPNGTPAVISNLTKDLSRVNLDISIGYDAELEKVIAVIDKVGADLAEDEEWREDILKAPHFLRVNDFADSAIVVKIVGDTRPARQWAVSGELRKRLKLAFDKNGIEIPFPQRVMHVPAEKKPTKKS